MTKEIPLTQGKVAIVDDEDYEKMSLLNWFAAKGETKFYAARCVWNGKRSKAVYMHNILLGEVPKGMMADHINGDGLDNRKCNLRLATKSQNTAYSRKRLTVNGKPTSSKYRGVCWDKRLGKWYAHIRVNYKRITLGYFVREEDAALAYNFGALQHFGDFAMFNKADL